MKRVCPFSCALFLFVILAACWCAAACQRAPVEPVSIAFVDPEWSHDTTQREEIMDAALQEFTKETGIQVRHLPAPESAADQLKLTKQLLDQGSADVYAMDVIWPGLIGDKLLDLRSLFATETAAEDPELISNFSVQNRLVAVPYHINVGVLYYRSNLLKEYGFQKSPKNWDELEKMAARIQAGERAKGNRDFWGYIWSGAAGEALTCDALEWQFAEGGGHIIEPDINEFRHSQKAAFPRGWGSDYFMSNPIQTEIFGREVVTAMSGGSFGRAGTTGGDWLGHCPQHNSSSGSNPAHKISATQRKSTR